MLETGIGRALNLALASLPNFKLPSDLSASNRYYNPDLIEPAFDINSDGTMSVPTGLGLGVNLVQERLTSLMNEAASSRDMQTRRDAWSYFQKSRPAWLDGTLKVWQAALQPSKAAPKKNPLDDESDGAFELVGTDVVENKILASRLVLGVTEKVSSQLNDLQVRMRVLTGHDEFEKDDILRPDVLVLKMVEQWGSCGMPRDSWPLVNDVVQTHLSERLKVAYTNANDLLIKQGVLPTIDLKDRVKRGAPVRGSGPGPRPTPPQAGLDSSLPPESSRGGYYRDTGGQGNYGDPGAGRSDPRAAARAPAPRHAPPPDRP
jgi:hypothetical protein